MRQLKGQSALEMVLHCGDIIMQESISWLLRALFIKRGQYSTTSMGPHLVERGMSPILFLAIYVLFFSLKCKYYYYCYADKQLQGSWFNWIIVIYYYMNCYNMIKHSNSQRNICVGLLLSLLLTPSQKTVRSVKRRL